MEREYPADASRVRELVLSLASLKVVERKTSDPANYAKLGVEAPDSAHRRQHAGGGGRGQEDLVADRRQGRRRPRRLRAQAGRGGERPGGAPFIAVDPDQKRWIDRLLVDVPGANVHDISVKPANGPAYLLTRA